MTPHSSFTELHKALNSGKTSCVETTQAYLSRISKHKNLNAFVEVFEKEALNRAKIIDAKIDKGTAGRLAGMVIGIKDNICFKNHKVSAASKILGGFESMFTATALQNLIDQDAIIIGRLNCDEFAMGSANENTKYGTVKTLWIQVGLPADPQGVCSRRGCRALFGCFRSDTGGSVRQPAAFCGVIGLSLHTPEFQDTD